METFDDYMPLKYIRGANAAFGLAKNVKWAYNALRGTTTRKAVTHNSVKVAQMNTKLNRLLKQIEYKYSDVQTSTAITTASPLIMDMTQIQEGDLSTERTGIKVSPSWMDFRYTLQRDNAGAAGAEFIRVLVVRAQQQVPDTAAVISDLLGSSPNQVVSPYQRLQDKKFDVLYDHVHKMVKDGDTHGVFVKKRFQLTSSKPFLYNGSAATDIQKNGIYIFFLTDQPTTGGFVKVFSRLRYADL